MAQEGFLRAGGHHADLVLIVIIVLPEAMEAILVPVGLDGADAPNDAGCEDHS